MRLKWINLATSSPNWDN